MRGPCVTSCGELRSGGSAGGAGGGGAARSLTRRRRCPCPLSPPTPTGARPGFPGYAPRQHRSRSPRQCCITIFNTRSYRRDSELEEAAKDHLVQAILRKEGPGIVDAAGGIQAVKDRIEIDTFWIEEG